ncbi:MAG: ATP-binding cassette domain-containing protein [Atribacterota bacterium]|jgi:simple sugar transport system ATP-binding protein|nr:ATP-binding cassette domain-containing protein [Atribacterota bacterium]
MNTETASIENETSPLLKIKGLTKRFGGVIALNKVDFDVNYNEVVGLLGDNGAGKSTMVKTIMGVFPPDQGEMFFMGKKISFRSPEEARAAGIEIVYQGMNLIETMNIWRNFFVGKEEVKKDSFFKFLDVQTMKQRTSENLEKVRVSMRSPDEYVNILSGGQKQSIAIGRALYFGAKLLILDEPTTALSVRETEKVLDFIKSLKKEGVSVIFITHNIYHVFDVADRFEILDHGIKIGSLSRHEADAGTCSPEIIMEIIRRGRKDA